MASNEEHTNKELLAQAKQVQLGNYRPGPFVLSRGEGRTLWDVEGNQFLDLTGGIAVLALGHSHPRLAKAIADQAGKLMHVSNLFYNDRAIELARMIVERTPYDKVYFCNSGTEANEALLKLARRFHFERGDTQRTEYVAAYKSFHGRSMGALSVTGQPKYHQGMEPLIPGVKFVDFNDIDGAKAAVSDKTAAIIVEPIQAEGGIIVGHDDYLRGLRQLADESGALLLFDEVQTGYGRTGRFLGSEWSGVVADACSLAKGIGGGFPLGAMCVTEKVDQGLPPGSHASTFGGNALACAAGVAVIETIEAEGLLDNVAKMGAHLETALESLCSDSDVVGAVAHRGRGLLQGIVLADDVDPLKTLHEIRGKGVLLTLAGGVVLRVSPALNVLADELDRGLEVVRRVLSNPPRKEATP